MSIAVMLCQILPPLCATMLFYLAHRSGGATIHGISVSVSNAECHRPAGSYYVSRQKSGNKSMTDKPRLLPRGHKGKISVELCQVLHCQHDFDPGDVTLILWCLMSTLHNVHFVKYVFLPTEQAETCLKSCVLINYSTYICLGLFGWKENMIFKETVTFKL